jgi:hypothetical protein
VILAFMMGDLIGRLLDHCDDPATTQLGAGSATGVRLVTAHTIGAGAGPTSAEPGHSKAGASFGLTGRDQHHQRAPTAVDEMVVLASQPAAGATDTVVRRLDAQIPVI